MASSSSSSLEKKQASSDEKPQASSSNSSIFHALEQKAHELHEVFENTMALIQREKEFYEKLHTHQVELPKVVKLNIGGSMFTTSLETMQNPKAGFFAAMFSGNWELKVSSDGSFFVDRDGTHFRYILNYLRTGQLVVSDKKNLDLLKELFVEVEFYGIEELIEELTLIISPPLPPLQFSPNSAILDGPMIATLQTMFPKKKAYSFRQLLSNSSGKDAGTFDNAVRGVGPIIVLIKSNAGHVFGGYVHDTYGSANVWKPSRESFLFTLGNISGKPAKLTHSGSNTNGVLDRCGLHMGSGNDLVAYCSYSCSAPQTYTVVPPEFSGNVPQPIPAGFLCGTPGTPNYTHSVMETYAVTFTD